IEFCSSTTGEGTTLLASAVTLRNRRVWGQVGCEERSDFSEKSEILSVHSRNPCLNNPHRPNLQSLISNLSPRPSVSRRSPKRENRRLRGRRRFIRITST